MLSFPADHDGNLGLANLGFAFKPPNGVGLSLDVGIVKGGGYLFIDAERGEYAGALELMFAEFLVDRAPSASSPRRIPDGSPGFSLLIIISVEFGTGIQLGFGFTLLGRRRPGRPQPHDEPAGADGGRAHAARSSR